MSGTRIKICGLSRTADIDAVNEVRPDYIGFVFAKSRRQVTPQRALELRKRLLPGIVPVGVFVNAGMEEIEALVQSGAIEMVQLHGQENETYIRELKRRTGKPVIKAVRVDFRADAERWLTSCADLLLFDNGAGGTGRRFDWTLIEGVDRPFLLAGGLDEKNIREAIDTVHPFGVDVSSGVETDGVKDPQKIVSIVRRIRE